MIGFRFKSKPSISCSAVPTWLEAVIQSISQIEVLTRDFGVGKKKKRIRPRGELRPSSLMFLLLLYDDTCLVYVNVLHSGQIFQ